MEEGWKRPRGELVHKFWERKEEEEREEEGRRNGRSVFRPSAYNITYTHTYEAAGRGWRQRERAGPAGRPMGFSERERDTREAKKQGCHNNFIVPWHTAKHSSLAKEYQENLPNIKFGK